MTQHPAFPRVRSLCRSVGAMSLLLALASCSDIVGVATTDQGAANLPARIALSASIGESAKQELVTLRISAAHLRADGQQVAIGAQVKTLTSDDVQSVPIPIDVASCLADALRSVEDKAAGVCRVMLALQLQVDGKTVDEQVVGPLSLKPGNLVDVAEPISLSVIDSIALTDASGAALDPASPVQLTLGAAFGIKAAILDDAGKIVANRNVTWSSSNAAIAAVDALGNVTTLSPGAVTIKAAVNAVQTTAQFVVLPPPVALTIAANPGSGSGTVVSNPAGIDCRLVNGVATGSCAFSFANNAQVTLTSTPDNGSAFLSWGDDCVASAVGVSCQLTLGTARIASAAFAAMRTITIANGAGDGQGRIAGAGLDCVVQGSTTSGVCEVSVVDGASVQLGATAQAAQGSNAAHLFTGWGGACAGTTAACSIVVQGGNVQVTSSFASPKVLSVQLSGNGAGSVSSTPIQCLRGDEATTGACTGSFMHGSNVTLTAAASQNSSFVSWGGACAGKTENTCVVAMTAVRSVQAVFTRNNTTLTLTLSGTGAGTVLVNGVTACSQSHQQPPTTCSISTVAGSTLSISATGGLHSTFDEFTGACTGTSGCQLIMQGNRSVDAQFSLEILSFRVTAYLGGAATGRIVGSEAANGVDCRLSNGVASGTCEFQAQYLAPVTLTAIPATNSALTQWGGSCESASTVVCRFTVTAAGEIGGAFAPAINVRMNISGNGTGSVLFDVSGVPQQPACNGNGASTVICTFALPTVPAGQRGVFRSVSGNGAAFTGFSGACSEQGTPPFVTCTFRGVGFARDVFGQFLR